MDNPVFVYFYIDNEEDFDDELQHDTPDTSRIEETVFTEQPAVRLRLTQNLILLRKYIIDLYRQLDVDPGNVDFVDIKKF